MKTATAFALVLAITGWLAILVATGLPLLASIQVLAIGVAFLLSAILLASWAHLRAILAELRDSKGR